VKVLRGSDLYFEADGSYGRIIYADQAVQDAAGKSLGLDGGPRINVQFTATTDGKVKFKTITITNRNGDNAVPDNELPPKMKAVMERYLAMPTLEPGSGAKLMGEMGAAMEEEFGKK
jgi:hypothetical protein